jgi:hypothetical protein
VAVPTASECGSFLSCILACVPLLIPARSPSAGEHLSVCSVWFRPHTRINMHLSLDWGGTWWFSFLLIAGTLFYRYSTICRHFKDKMQHLGRKEETKWSLLVCKVLESRGTMSCISERRNFSIIMGADSCRMVPPSPRFLGPV